MNAVESIHQDRIASGLAHFTVSELQLLLLGLWIIGEENRIEPRLTTKYGWLLNGAHSALQQLIPNYKLFYRFDGGTARSEKARVKDERKCRCGHNESAHYNNAGRCRGSGHVCGCVLFRPDREISQ